MSFPRQTLRTSQLVKSAALYYKTNDLTDWVRLKEAYPREVLGKGGHKPILTEPSNVENIVFDGGIQIEQAAEKYDMSYKATSKRAMEKAESRWRIRFEYEQYTNVFVREYARPHAQPGKPPIAFIEVVFDIVTSPSGTDITASLPQAPNEAFEAPKTDNKEKETKVEMNTDMDMGMDQGKGKGKEKEDEAENQAPSITRTAEDEEQDDFEWEEAEVQPARELPLAYISEDKELGLTSLRLVFARPKASSGSKQWSWPATVRSLQGYRSYDKPDSLIKSTWQSILAGTLHQFAAGGLNNSGLIPEDDGFRIPAVVHHKDEDVPLVSSPPSPPSPREASPQIAPSEPGPAESSRRKERRKRVASQLADRQREPKRHKEDKRDKLDREWREATIEEEWLEKDITARRNRLNELRDIKSKNRREFDALSNER
ncbi:MAG: hypothetical protein Q9216_004233 [Gyalolechia sp. 2 TL-2023]